MMASSMPNLSRMCSRSTCPGQCIHLHEDRLFVLYPRRREMCANSGKGLSPRFARRRAMIGQQQSCSPTSPTHHARQMSIGGPRRRTSIHAGGLARRLRLSPAGCATRMPSAAGLWRPTRHNTRQARRSQSQTFARCFPGSTLHSRSP